MLVPFAAGLAAACREAMRTLALPNLRRLLARMACLATDEGDETALSMPHERALAREYGIAAPDGRIPWAAWQVAQAGGETHGTGWAFITPCHWQVGTSNVVMGHPQHLGLAAEHSQRLLQAMQPYFEQDGIRLEYEGPTRWLAHGEVFRDQPAASLDRVVGRMIDAWLARNGQATALRRLQQEMQMLLYTHPVNDERAGAGLQPVNSFWVSGTGALPAGGRTDTPDGLRVTQGLRAAALQGDWAAWAAAWQRLDAGEVARLGQQLDRGEYVRVTLCGERSSRTWAPAGGGWWQRVSRNFSQQPAAAQLLEAL